MGRKLWFGQLGIVVILTFVTEPTSASQLAINPEKYVLNEQAAAHQMINDAAERDLAAPASIMVSTVVRPKPKDELANHGVEQQPADSAAHQTAMTTQASLQLQTNMIRAAATLPATPLPGRNRSDEQNLTPPTGKNTDNKNSEAIETTKVSGLPSLPKALGIFVLGILGILSVRRTNDHSNVT